MLISHKARTISPSPTLAIDAKAKQMKGEGHDVVGFGAGEPDFDTPDYIKESAISAINHGFTKYTPVDGIEELKQTIVKYLKLNNNITYTTNQISVSNGAKQCLYNALFCLINPGDKVLIPSPYWVSYPEMVKLCGGIPIFVPTTENQDFMLKADTLEEYIDEKTKVLIINSPNNPCGSIYSKQDLEEIAQLVIKHNLFVISDEIYEKLIYDGTETVSIVSLNKDITERALIVNGMSKSFAMTGWRIGFAAGPTELIKAMSSFQGHCTSNPNSIAQKASVEALVNPVKEETIEIMVNEFSKRRDYMVEKINSIKNLSCRKPKGAFYIFMNISKTFSKKCCGEIISDSTSFSKILLDKYKVAVVPGVGFGSDDYVRLSYATSLENIKKGLNRIEEFANSLQ